MDKIMKMDEMKFSNLLPLCPLWVLEVCRLTDQLVQSLISIAGRLLIYGLSKNTQTKLADLWGSYRYFIKKKNKPETRG